MGDYGFAAGLVLAIFGPLLLLVPAAALFWLLGRLGVAERMKITGRGSVRAAHALLALLTVAVVVVGTWLPGRLKFARLCDELAEPRIYERSAVDGFYLDDSTANSFGQRYLTEEGFVWMEAKDPYRNTRLVRYRRNGETVISAPLPEVTASHIVRSDVDARENGIHIARTEIIDRDTGKLLAEAHSVVYHGGPLGPVLGVYGLANCPDPASAEGSRQFDLYYHLVREVLGKGDFQR